MKKYKDGFASNAGSSTTVDIDVFVHASLTCPKLAHSNWATFVYPYQSTSAATGITGDYGADGCYGKTCDGCSSSGSYYTDSSGCCSISTVSSSPTQISHGMATGYINYLKQLTVCDNTDGPSTNCKSASNIVSTISSRR